MKLARLSYTFARVRAFLFGAALGLAPAVGAAHESGAQHVHFQKPSRGASAQGSSASLQFRSSSTAKNEASAPAAAAVEQSPAETQAVAAASHQVVAKPLSEATKPLAAPAVTQAVRQAAAQTSSRPVFAQPSHEAGDLADYRSARQPQDHCVVALDHSEPLFSAPSRRSGVLQTSFYDSCLGCSDPACGITEPACGCDEPACGICEPACGLEEPGCGLEPECGMMEPGCGVFDPSCGCDEPECGSCVGRPGPDYWCFPVCLPRFKDFTLWAGVHGFKGPRDSPNNNFGGSGNNNFGFQEGVNLGGRAPLVGLVFPQLSYQVGYQAVQSQLSGDTSGGTQERLQDFVTAGVFRRTPAGLQLGAVWDYQSDDYIMEEDFHQIRYEVSIKSQRGREIGFWGASHTNNNVSGAIDYQAVDQYNAFLRCHFQGGSELRFWFGGSNDGEGVFGGDAYLPFNNSWSLQSGFNYLIPEMSPGPDAAQNESWNVGINLVWHYGRTAKKSATNPHRPLFGTADNGSMFIDARP